MELGKYKDEIYNRKIQIVEVDLKGSIIESEDSLFKLHKSQNIKDVHPFFEGILPLFEKLSEKINFPCVNLQFSEKIIIADIDIIPENGKIIILIFDFTTHYQESQPLVQEKNEASILKHKLSFERDILIAKEDLKNQFLAHLNHEIRNPLNNMLGFMEILDNTKLSYEQKETLNIMNKTGTHLKVLLDDLLDISKIEKGITVVKHIPFSLSQVFNSLVKHFKLKYDKKEVQLELEMDDDLPIRLLGDPTRLNQIVFNLIENAYRNTKKGGISIHLSVKKKDDKLNRTFFTIVISDTGVGIPKKELPFIFDSYHQLEFDQIKPIGEGLGLKIVKDLVGLMQGQIKVESIVGEGTTYAVTIPFEERQKKETKKKSVPKGTGIVISKRILIVENDEITQMLMMKTFLSNDDGYLIEIARDGAQAIDFIENRKYNLVLLKMDLPDMNGYEILRHLRNNSNNNLQTLPVLVVSGSNMKDEQDAVIAAGASQFLSKPYTKKELFAKIDNVLKK
ncbi:ATP-binding response regulator [Ulvibacter antarcticus]|uniref:histidine kinase n=1 Tax=Ulvibacter antarcticus TaxID=442714 RepID=A0A3L9ZHJ8_9FLAO|nr:ATP-binding protein [Ulvibacter antarcticus]RMA66182.1 phospho-acceptor domain-containing protein [Ulvibacter antarcticus]